jgi:predicted MarR family transcription regulator
LLATSAGAPAPDVAWPCEFRLKDIAVPRRPSRPLPPRSRPGLAPLNRRWHLARDTHEIELTEFEYAAIRFYAAFQRWNEAAVCAAGSAALTFTEASMLHVIRMQERPKSISLIANLLNRDDIPNLQYGLRKLRTLELIRTTGAANRKNYAYEVTPRGRALTDRIAEIATELVFSSTRALADVEPKLVASADLLRLMTGIFDEAARIAGTFTPADPLPSATPARTRRSARRSAPGRPAGRRKAPT